MTEKKFGPQFMAFILKLIVPLYIGMYNGTIGIRIHIVKTHCFSYKSRKLTN